MSIKKIMGAGALVVLAFSGAAAASTITLSFNSNTNWTTGDRVFDNGPQSVTLNGATHTSGTNLDFNAGLASWGGSGGGLGVCSSLSGNFSASNSTSRCREEHTVDTNGTDELVTFDFGSLIVELTSITFAYVNNIDDFDVYSYGASFADLVESSTRNRLPNARPDNLRTVTATNFSATQGSLFAIGVSGGRGDDDSVKLQAVSFSIVPPPPPPPAPIPLPAAGWMLLAGMGGLAAIRRRRHKA